MRRIWIAAAVLLLAGCGVEPSGVTDGGPAPTGVAPGPTLYFVDGGELRATVRDTGRLGTIAEALSLLLSGPGDADLDTEIAPTAFAKVEVTVTGQEVELRVPLSTEEVTPLGIDQIVCTALAAHVQNGGSTEATVRLRFTLEEPGSRDPRTCPLL
ncbi:hypothetical protein LO763_05355 [Glycomyces sp. A-F 0318]|uniref:hypothetical protein n=1 Tax=Glycomyces amatae TaxID=2881355 RepID=UPI001E3D2B52|nr:hypothetical protein [Glycomyces amatae]MCD0443053.1 hypothetical protein [Glycomyces amatae]